VLKLLLWTIIDLFKLVFFYSLGDKPQALVSKKKNVYQYHILRQGT